MSIVAQPSTKINDAPDFCSPYMLGVMDAEEKQPCVPETYFTKRGQMCEYCEGYEAVAGETMTTCQILGKPQPATTDAPSRFAAMLVAMVGDDDMNAMIELIDLREGREDNEFWSRGQW